MKGDIIRSLIDCGVVAVIRAKDVDEAVKLADCCVEGGIVGLEITFTVPGCEDVIAKLASKKDAKYIVGAGTVLDATTARIAIMKGAKFIVSLYHKRGTFVNQLSVMEQWEIPGKNRLF